MIYIEYYVRAADFNIEGLFHFSFIFLLIEIQVIQLLKYSLLVSFFCLQKSVNTDCILKNLFTEHIFFYLQTIFIHFCHQCWQFLVSVIEF